MRRFVYPRRLTRSSRACLLALAPLVCGVATAVCDRGPDPLFDSIEDTGRFGRPSTHSAWLGTGAHPFASRRASSNVHDGCRGRRSRHRSISQAWTQCRLGFMPDDRARAHVSTGEHLPQPGLVTKLPEPSRAPGGRSGSARACSRTWLATVGEPRCAF